MGGVNVDGGGGGKRKTLDSEVNMIPMIDLLMVTISFLLITAVWTHMARLDASAKVPGPPTAQPCEETGGCEPDKELHVDARGADHFVLTWRQKGIVLSSVDVPRAGSAGTAPVHYPTLASAIEKEWTANGAHRSATDDKRDHAVLHAANGSRYEEMIAAMDAIERPQRPYGKGKTPAFAVTLAND